VALRDLIDDLRQMGLEEERARQIARDRCVILFRAFKRDRDLLVRIRGRRSREEMAARLGLSVAGVRDLERGRLARFPDDAELLRLFEVYLALSESDGGGDSEDRPV
jgi:hypothetical protein